MTSGALKYYRNAIYHLEMVRNAYKANISSMNLLKNSSLSVMDIGCGSGRVLYDILIPLLPRNTTEIIASDIDENMLEFSRSLNKDPRVSFERLDIEDETVPKHLQNRFDVLFSSYCFTYVKNLRQGFANCRHLLKPNGEISCLFQFKANGLHLTYRRMSNMEKWKPYTKDYTEQTPHLTGPDPELELKTLFKDVDMTLLGHQFDHDVYFDITKREILENYIALDQRYHIVPANEQNDYSHDFVKILSEETDFDFVDEKTLDDRVLLNFPTVYIHAKKKHK